MTEKQSKKGFPALLEKILTLVDGVRGIILILGALSVGGASGTLFAGSGDAERLDTLEARQDTLETRLDSAEVTQKRMERNQIEMYSAQIEADSTLKAVLEGRAANRRKAAEARAETNNLFNELTGGIP